MLSHRESDEVIQTAVNSFTCVEHDDEKLFPERRNSFSQICGLHVNLVPESLVQFSAGALGKFSEVRLQSNVENRA